MVLPLFRPYCCGCALSAVPNVVDLSDFLIWRPQSYFECVWIVLAPQKIGFGLSWTMCFGFPGNIFGIYSSRPKTVWFGLLKKWWRNNSTWRFDWLLFGVFVAIFILFCEANHSNNLRFWYYVWFGVSFTCLNQIVLVLAWLYFSCTSYLLTVCMRKECFDVASVRFCFGLLICSLTCFGIACDAAQLWATSDVVCIGAGCFG